MIREYEKTKPKQHPVGLTGHGAEKLASMMASPADWISPGRVDGYAEDPPAWNGRKVSILDTDHIWGVGGNVAWVWKSFLRGHNPIFMDPYDGSVLGKPDDKQWEGIRRAMGNARKMAEHVNLQMLQPRVDLASTKYCLASPGREYLVFQPEGGKPFSVALSGSTFHYEWYVADTGSRSPERGEVTATGSHHEFTPPFEGSAILHLKAK
jgi:hypothetical protein